MSVFDGMTQEQIKAAFESNPEALAKFSAALDPYIDPSKVDFSGMTMAEMGQWADQYTTYTSKPLYEGPSLFEGQVVLPELNEQLTSSFNTHDQFIEYGRENPDTVWVEHVGGDRFTIPDIGAENFDTYLSELTNAGYLPESPVGWETHRTEDGRISISPDYPDQNWYDNLFPTIVTGAMGLMGGGALAGSLGLTGATAGGVTGATSSAIQQGLLTGSIDPSQVLQDTIVSTAGGWAAGDTIPTGDPSGALNLTNVIGYTTGQYDYEDYETVDPEGNTAPMIGETVVNSRPGWDWLWNTVTGRWEAVPVEEDEVAKAEGSTGGSTPSGGGTPDPADSTIDRSGTAPPPGVWVMPNHEERDDEVWRHTNPDGTVVASNGMGEVWEVQDSEGPADDPFINPILVYTIGDRILSSGGITDGTVDQGGPGGTGDTTDGTQTDEPGTGETPGPGDGDTPGDDTGDTPDGDGDTPGDTPDGPGGPGGPGTGDEGDGPDDGPGGGTGSGGLFAGAGGENEWEDYYTRIRKNFELYELMNIPSEQYLKLLTQRMMT